MDQDLTALAAATWNDLTELQPDNTKTAIERCPLDVLNLAQRTFRKDGLVVVRGLIPMDVLDAYTAVREQLPKDRSAKDNYWSGWHKPTPYMHCQALRTVATFPNLMHQANALIGDVMGLHLALTGFVSTERAFHQDSYLNFDLLWSHYIACWIALDDIDADSGPFQFVRGSHLWPVLRQGKLFSYLTEDQQKSPDWPSFTQGHVARVCEEEILARGADVEEYVPKKGDVLFWHSNLIHRGSKPKNPELLRKALICHFSGVIRRYDMKRMQRDDETGQLYFHIQ